MRTAKDYLKPSTSCTDPVVSIQVCRASKPELGGHESSQAEGQGGGAVYRKFRSILEEVGSSYGLKVRVLVVRSGNESRTLELEISQAPFSRCCGSLPCLRVSEGCS